MLYLFVRFVVGGCWESWDGFETVFSNVKVSNLTTWKKENLWYYWWRFLILRNQSPKNDHDTSHLITFFLFEDLRLTSFDWVIMYLCVVFIGNSLKQIRCLFISFQKVQLSKQVRGMSRSTTTPRLGKFTPNTFTRSRNLRFSKEDALTEFKYHDLEVNMSLGCKDQNWKVGKLMASASQITILKCKKIKDLETIDDPHQYLLKSTLNRCLGGPETSQHIEGHGASAFSSGSFDFMELGYLR